MFQSVRFKLFLTFLAISLSVVAGMYLFLRWSLNQGFSELTETRQRERVNNLIDGLTDYYSSNQNWDRLQNDKQKWIDLLLQSNPRNRMPEWTKYAFTEPNNIWPPALTEEQIKRKFTPFELSVMLLNADKKIIFGRQDTLQQLSLLPIRYQEKLIGFLGLLPGKTISHISEIRFMERQSESFVWIAVIMVAMSGCLAFLLAYLLGRPLKRITSAAKTLAIGQYDVRLPVESVDELGQLSRDFNDLAAALEHSEQARRRWMADISHELRTPLAILRGELEALQDGIRPLTIEAIDSLQVDVMRLHRLTEDLYQLSLSDQGALSYRKEHINPVEVLKEDLEAITPLFQSKQINITWNNTLAVPVKIYADPDRLSQLFKNLLNNSVNYTNDNGHLVINIHRDSENLLLEFADSEPGVDEEELSKLFERFYRVDSSRNRFRGGAGLGLSICNNIVQAHNGWINVAASLMKGISIQIKLPLSL